jgi:hypothetical protein
MSRPDYIPQADAKFFEWATVLIRNLGKLINRIDFPEDRYAQLKQLFDDFKQKFKVATSPSTRTKPAVLDKNQARDALKKAIRRAVKEYLVYNHRVTDHDRGSLRLPVYKTTRTPAKVAETYPHFSIDSSMLRCLTIHFCDTGHEKSKAKPPGQHGAEIRWVISDTPIVQMEELLHSSFDTRTPFTFEFDGHQRGKTVYFALCWVNTRGKKGPWSAIESAFIP